MWAAILAWVSATVLVETSIIKRSVEADPGSSARDPPHPMSRRDPETIMWTQGCSLDVRPPQGQSSMQLSSFVKSIQYSRLGAITFSRRRTAASHELLFAPLKGIFVRGGVQAYSQCTELRWVVLWKR